LFRIGFFTADDEIQPPELFFLFVSECVDSNERIHMQSLPAKSVDICITDPPFAIDFKAKRGNYNCKDSRVLEGYCEVNEKDYLAFTRNWMTEIKRVLKENGSMYVFSGWNNLKDILITLDDLGFTTVNHLIWKYQFGVVTSRKFVTSHYHCLYVCLDDKKRKFFPYWTVQL